MSQSAAQFHFQLLKASAEVFVVWQQPHIGAVLSQAVME